MDELTTYEKALIQFRKECEARYPDTKDRELFYSYLNERGTPEDVRASAVHIQTEVASKYGDKDNANVMQKVIRRTLQNTNTIIAAGTWAMQFAPESVSVVWWAVGIVLNAAQSNMKLYEQFGSGLADTTDIMVLIAHYDRVYTHEKTRTQSYEMTDKLFNGLQNIYVAILNFGLLVKRHYYSGRTGAMRHAVKDLFGLEFSKFKGKLDQIAALKLQILEDTRAVYEGATLERLNAVQDYLQDMKDFQATTREFNESFLQITSGIRDALEKVSKGRSPWERAMQGFEENREFLNPLPAPVDSLESQAVLRHPGTCTWILEQAAFDEWSKATSHTLLCLGGDAGVGKTMALSIIAERVAEMPHDMPNGVFVEYLSCDTHQLGGADVDPSNFHLRLVGAMIFQLYELATADKNNVELLEDCNRIISRPKKGKIVTSQGGAAGDLLDLTEALLALCKTLKKAAVFFVDAVDRMVDADQRAFYRVVQGLLKKAKGVESNTTPVLRVVVATRHGLFWDLVQDELHLEMSSGNKSDVEKTLVAEMELLPRWSPSEKQEAQKIVLQNAGSSFTYVQKVALPFLRQPFPRPLSKYLAKLPKNIDDAYEDALASLSPNYLGLLEVALSWVLFAPIPIAVRVIMDDFNGRYRDETSGEAASPDQGQDELELQQLHDAGKVFLKIIPGDAQRPAAVTVRDESVTNFWLKSRIQTATQEDKALCASCQKSLQPQRRLHFDGKQGHLELALKMLRNVNNPEFRKHFGLVAKQGGAEIRDRDTEAVSNADSDTSSGQKFDVDGDDLDGRSHVTKQAGDAGDNDSDLSVDDHDLVGLIVDDEEDVPFMDDDFVVFNQEGELIMRSIQQDPFHDVVDRLFDFILADDGLPDGQAVFSDSPHLELDNRCEIFSWCHHLRQAELLWSLGQRKQELSIPGSTWAKVLAEVTKLGDHHQTFRLWQEKAFPGSDSSLPILHIAVSLELMSWTENLIGNGANVNEVKAGLNPLQIACKAQDTRLLRLLLESGADPMLETEDRLPGFHWWVLTHEGDMLVEGIELMLRHGADVTTPNKVQGWHALLYFAATAEDHNIDCLDLLLPADTEARKTVLNLASSDQYAPLHILLGHIDKNLSLLEVFLRYGADPNVDDRKSKRPLQTAALRGNAGVVEKLLPYVTDIDDEDVHGRTALQEAAWAGNLDCVERLAVGVDVDGTRRNAALTLADHHQRTPLFFACLSPFDHSAPKDDGNCALWLLDRLIATNTSAAEINRVTKGNRSPLRQAAASGFAKVVERLLEVLSKDGTPEVMASLNLQDLRYERTPLHVAAWRGRSDCCALLLDAGADMLLEDKAGDSALMLACKHWAVQHESSFEETVGLLIDRDPMAAVRASVVTELINTAVANGSLPILKKLQSLGADLDRRDQHGWTPLQLAHRYGHTGIREFLKDHIMLTAASPSRWIDIPSSIVVSEDGPTLTYQKDKHLCLSSDKAIPAGLDKYYFEIETVSIDDASQSDSLEMAIGFCTIGAGVIERAGYRSRKAPSARSWAYYATADFVDSGFTPTYYDTSCRYKFGDTVGCGVDFTARTIWFTKNGVKLKKTFEGVDGRLFPLVGLCAPVKIVTNFNKSGKPFMWKDKL